MYSFVAVSGHIIIALPMNSYRSFVVVLSRKGDEMSDLSNRPGSHALDSVRIPVARSCVICGGHLATVFFV